MKFTAEKIKQLLESFNWAGHCEFPDVDMKWLAREIADKLSGDGYRCENCGLLKEVIVELPIGDMCERCLSDAQQDAGEIRRSHER